LAVAEKGEIVSLRRYSLLGVCALAVLLVISGAASAAKSYPDRVGDVRGGAAPDLASVTVSNTRTRVTFRVRFAKAPPLRVSTREGWIDMLLIGIDVPPLGPPPASPGGEWHGANFGLGTHGPAKTGLLVKLGEDPASGSRRVASFEIVTSGSALTFSIPRRALGSPAWFTFMVAAAREGEQEATGGGVDIAPDRGTFRYALTG
jgi:hypothetical protein